MKVLVFGALNIDYVYAVDHAVAPGETESSYSLREVAGGKGLNQAAALRKAGADTYMAGQIGAEGKFLAELLQNYGVNTDFVRVMPGKSGHAMIQVDKNGQNCILLYGGANRAQERTYMDEVLAHFGTGDMLVLQNEINELSYLIDRAYERGVFIVLNPSPYDALLKDCDLKKVSLFLVNELEGAELTGKTAPEEIGAAIRALYPEAETVLTLGKDGSVFFGKEETVFQNAYPVKAVDTTAAGDTFTGYFLAGIGEGRTKKEAMDRASRASSIACTREGAAPSIPDRSELN